MFDENLVVVFRAENGPQAYMVRDQLQAEGVPARVDGDFLQGAMGGVPLGWASSPRVLVAESDVAAANKILAHLEPSPPAD
jgi:hypothetical protein